MMHLLLCLAVNLACQQDPRPNILLIYSDDHSAQAVGAYGLR